MSRQWGLPWSPGLPGLPGCRVAGFARVARLLGCPVARLLGCPVARVAGFARVARLLGCPVAGVPGCPVRPGRPGRGTVGTALSKSLYIIPYSFLVKGLNQPSQASRRSPVPPIHSIVAIESQQQQQASFWASLTLQTCKQFGNQSNGPDCSRWGLLQNCDKCVCMYFVFTLYIHFLISRTVRTVILYSNA